MAQQRPRNSWLRDMLRDKGLQDRDLAKALEITPGGVSRLLNSRDAENFSLSELRVIARVLGMDMMQLQAKIAERPLPLSKAELAKTALSPRAATAPDPAPHKEDCDDTVEALTTLRAAVDQARRLLPPGCKIHISIDYPGLTNNGSDR